MRPRVSQPHETPLDRALRTDEALDTMRAAFTAKPSRPVQIAEVLDAALAQQVADALEASPDWKAEQFIDEPFGGIKQVDSRIFLDAPPEICLAKWEKLAFEAQPQLDVLWRLLEHLRSDESVGALSTLGQPGVGPPHFKVVRYRPGDFFAPHFDGDAGIALLMYFTRPAWRDGDGGTFAYEDETGHVTEYAPSFNTALIFPYRANTRHWVCPVADQAGLRYTISADYAD
jgi:2OG-Fe(II) oxygenase superfamily